MFGVQQMIQNMLEEMGVDIPTLTAEAQKAYQDARAMAESMTRAQGAILNVLQANYRLQHLNGAKLDAIMAHLGISLPVDEETADGQRRIEFDADPARIQ